uniref:Protein LLP homolog n=1 Tax=Canis lupus familiaris TaxID=9615 RepID=A0A8I3PMX5_CANLF
MGLPVGVAVRAVTGLRVSRFPGNVAKSLRSKWKRKMHAEKRKKNAPKELSRLKSILKMDGDVLMKDVQGIATVLVPKHCQEQTQCVVQGEKDDMKMETEMKRNRKSLIEQHGQYPIWTNQRQRKRLRQSEKKGRGKAKPKQQKQRRVWLGRLLNP